MKNGKENRIEDYQETGDVYARLRELEQEKRRISNPKDLEMLEQEIFGQFFLESHL